MADTTITGVYGRQAADELAAIAVEMLRAAPEREPPRTPAGNLMTRSAKVSWQLVLAGRQAMDRHGMPWRRAARGPRR